MEPAERGNIFFINHKNEKYPKWIVIPALFHHIDYRLKGECK